MALIAKNLFAAAILVLALMPRNAVAAEAANTPAVLQKDSKAYLKTDELHQGLKSLTEDGQNGTAVIGDAARGQDLFRRCRACHSAKAGGGHKIGPNLHGIFGRRIATAPTFSYSPALSSVRRSWDEETLDLWLTAPNRFAAGTLMTFSGLAKPQDRADLIAYLKTLDN